MEKQKREIVTITKVYSDTNSYMIMEDLGRYVWTDEMLEPVIATETQNSTEIMNNILSVSENIHDILINKL